MIPLVVKVLLAPGFVVGASLVARRFGAQVGGMVGGLPVVAGPILLAFALDQGAPFAARAAVGTLLGLVSLTTFSVVYAHLAARAPWPVCLVAGWAAFLAMTAVLSGVHVAAWVALLAACAAFVIGLRLLPHLPPRAAQAVSTRPGWDLPGRAGAALAMVLALTAAASSLGSHLSGLLAPFPIIASILASFTHAQSGSAEAARMLRGLVLGYVAFALFCAAVAETIEPLGIAASFALATVAALAAQGVALRWAAPGRPA